MIAYSVKIDRPPQNYIIHTAQTQAVIMHSITTDAELAAMHEKHKCVICIFSAPWCGPCKNLKLGLNDFMEQQKDIGWVMVDVDEAETMCAEHKIKQIPHVKFYVAKKKHCDLSGPCAQDVIATAQNVLRM